MGGEIWNKKSSRLKGKVPLVTDRFRPKLRDTDQKFFGHFTSKVHSLQTDIDLTSNGGPACDGSATCDLPVSLLECEAR